MAPTRREFIDRSLAMAGALALPPLARPLAAAPGPVSSTPRAAKSLRILFLGGTGFIGPHMVRYAMYRGHQVSLFNRGRTAPSLFPGAEQFLGDRDGKLDALKGHEWDAVVDNSGYVPRHVRDSATLLKDAAGRYVFISTGSVYKLDQDSIDEDAELLPVEDPKSEDVNKYYGPLKVLCEQAVDQIYGPRSTVLRLHIVAGPGDTTDRFTFWPVRIDWGGEVIAPGEMNNPVQFIDVRDLAEFTIHVLERDTGGTFNVAGPTLQPTSMAEFLYGIRAVTSAPVKFTWVDEKFLTERRIRYPLWIPQNGPARGIVHVKSHRGVAAGLKFRPLAVTAADTLEWFKAEPAERQQKLNLNLERDAKALEEWRAARATGRGR
jgi:2'-hydroxyisoflavone reductase